VSAVATILGLMLVVVFIANYIATTLPNTMGQNELQHETQVENQVSELSALLQAVAVNGVVGAQVSQPISMGSAGAPPFAGPDGSTLTSIAPVNNTTGTYPAENVSFSLTGPGGVQVNPSPIGIAGFVVNLENTYSPSAAVAFDQGAVLYIQPGAYPIFIMAPRIGFSNNVLSIFFPRFQNLTVGEAGTGTAVMSFRLLAATKLYIPTSSFSFTSGSSVVIKIVTPYAASWYAYFEATTAFSTLVTCSGPNSVCSALYQPGRSLGTVTLTIPTSGLTMNFLSALYAVTVS